MTYLEAAYERFLKKFGGRPFRSEDVSRELGLKPGYVKNLLSELRRRNWVSVIPDPKDARRAFYRLDLAAASEINTGKVRSLLSEYSGEYVLMVNGRIVEKGSDVEELLKRALRKYEPHQIYITNVGRPREVVTVGF